MPTRQNRVRNKPLPLWLDNFQQALRPSNRARTIVDFRIIKYTIENEGGPLTPYTNINSKQTKDKKNLKLYTIPRKKEHLQNLDLKVISWVGHQNTGKGERKDKMNLIKVKNCAPKHEEHNGQNF